MRFRWLATVLLAAGAAPAVSADRTQHLLAELADAPSPPGFEEAVRTVVVRELRPISDEVRFDGVGSVIARAGTSGPKMMLDAHMDELGRVVRRVTPGEY
jgi:putative aminopeptidase FrvX